MKLFRPIPKLNFAQRLTLLHSRRVITFGSALLLRAYALTLSPSSTLIVDMHRLVINLSSNLRQLPTHNLFKQQTNFKPSYGKPFNYEMMTQGSLRIVDGCILLYNCTRLSAMAVPGVNFTLISVFGITMLVEITNIMHPLALIYPTQSFVERMKMVPAILTRKLRTHWMLESMTWATMLNLACCSLPLLTQLLPLLALDAGKITASIGLCSL